MQHRTQEQLNKLPDAKRSKTDEMLQIMQRQGNETNEKHFAKVERFGDTVNGLIAQTSDTPDLEHVFTHSTNVLEGS